MPGHQMPTRTKRRLIAASMAAVALIGTAVAVGIYGNATAADGNNVAAASQCLPDDGQATSSAPAPTTTSESTAPPAGTETQPPAETETKTEAPPAETETAGTEPVAYGMKLRQPSDPTQPPTEGPSANGSEAAPDEKGAPPPTAPPAPAPSETEQTFGDEDCVEALGPFPQDFVKIRNVARSNLDPRPGRNASRGTFVSRCGTNGNQHQNPDNFIVAPGVRNGAHHLHDYVGNLSADANSTNESLEAAGTTCQGGGDKSTYYWPVMRVRDANGAGTPDAENAHNIGTVLRPRSATLQFRGNAQAKVVAMPKFIRAITGDAKASINGGANANAKWGCTGFQNRFSPKYTLCPRGSALVRQLDFASCWDGTNIDSANHRAHIVFPDKSGACPQGTKAVPALRMTLTYNIPRGRLFAVDAFPEVVHSPLTDHGDFVNVMSDRTMARVVDCLNRGRNC